MSAVARPTLQRLPLAAALTALATLLVTLLLGPAAPSLPSIVLAAAAVSLLFAELTRRARELLLGGLGHQIALALLAVAVVAAGWSLVATTLSVTFGLIFALGLGGTALVTLAILRLSDGTGAGPTPWQSLTSTQGTAAASRARFRLLGPLLVGVIAALAALRQLAVELMSGVNGGPPDRAWALGAVMVVMVVAGPFWATRNLARGRIEQRRAAPVARDEQVVAAHLHDSVLQTLALIQRADDPGRMVQLARQQERSLRAWLAGRDDAVAASLAEAVRLAAHTVEDEQPGAAIEVVIAGDAPLDAGSDALVLAAREAMRNAVRHGDGTVHVLLEVAGDGARELFVRDTGSGFDLAGVGEERRGVRDAIMGRMGHAGGTATIDSGPAGTVIALRLPPPRNERTP
ncbi:MAG: hypothetical protein Q7T55_26870 [Solirubrobacteraceae bacterium]|nr:hypothetical protein [Solirubrobacteraceae bacterium]